MNLRYDVVIYEVETGLVTGLGEFSVDHETAERTVDRLNQLIKTDKTAQAVPAGSKIKGSTMPPVPSREVRTSPRRARRPIIVAPQYRNPKERQAACVCIVCESPDLRTRIHCERCAAKANIQSSSAHRNIRQPVEK